MDDGSSGSVLGSGQRGSLMARESATNGQLDDPAPWVVLGVVPWALGLLVALARLVRHGRTAVRV